MAQVHARVTERHRSARPSTVGRLPPADDLGVLAGRLDRVRIPRVLNDPLRQPLCRVSVQCNHRVLGGLGRLAIARLFHAQQLRHRRRDGVELEDLPSGLDELPRLLGYLSIHRRGVGEYRDRPALERAVEDVLIGHGIDGDTGGAQHLLHPFGELLNRPRLGGRGTQGERADHDRDVGRVGHQVVDRHIRVALAGLPRGESNSAHLRPARGRALDAEVGLRELVGVPAALQPDVGPVPPVT